MRMLVAASKYSMQFLDVKKPWRYPIYGHLQGFHVGWVTLYLPNIGAQIIIAAGFFRPMLGKTPTQRRCDSTARPHYDSTP